MNLTPTAQCRLVLLCKLMSLKAIAENEMICLNIFLVLLTRMHFLMTLIVCFLCRFSLSKGFGGFVAKLQVVRFPNANTKGMMS